MQCACAMLLSVACPAAQYFSTLCHKRRSNGQADRYDEANTDGTPYPRIRYPWFQLSAVDRGPKEIWKINEINVS
jgi:hypothetical protein